MQRWCRTLLGAGLLILAGCGQRVLVQPQADMSAYNRIAILPFETDSFLSTIGHELADEIMVAVLEKAPNVELVERGKIDDLLQEQQLVRSGYISVDSAVSVGKLLGVKAIVTGSVAVSIGDIQPTPLSPQRVATGTATMRFVDVTTGRILWAKRAKSEYSSFTQQPDGLAPYNAMTDHEMIQAVIRGLGEQLAQQFYPHYEIR
ncbi:MAG: CsgG/HfaB family protein [candidate division FCPU426 bacterium]